LFFSSSFKVFLTKFMIIEAKTSAYKFHFLQKYEFWYELINTG